MPEITVEQLAAALEACRQNTAGLNDLVARHLDAPVALSMGESTAFDAAALPAALYAPGLMVTISAGDQDVLCLIPSTLPLPNWLTPPNEEEQGRLQAFARELAALMIPAGYASQPRMVESLQQPLAGAPITASARIVTFVADGETAGRLFIIGPLAQAAPAIEPEPESPAASKPTNAPENDAASARDAALRALRIMRVPVTVSVRLAERKMPLGQVAGFGPGGLITFNKSCEDLLDLYVNNHHYARGETVKIGEHFGLKISKVGNEP